MIVSSTRQGSHFDGSSARAASQCGYDVREADTYRGSGLRPGLTIFFVGPYRSQARANRVVRDCVPDTYVKWGDT